MSKSEVSDQVEQTEQTEQAKETHTTLVKVRQTKIKFFKTSTNEVAEVVVTGKLTVPECNEYVKMLDAENVFILKETVNDEFRVNTVALLQIKESV